jgi:hypothetical protein
MRRLFVVVAALLATAAIAVPVALGNSPHYVNGPSVSTSGNALTVSWKAAGLGSQESIDFTLTGTIDVTSQCFTKSGNPVNGVPKSEEITVNTTGNFPIRNGQVTGSLSVEPLSTLTCTGSQRARITDLSFDLFLNGAGLPTVEFTS